MQHGQYYPQQHYMGQQGRVVTSQNMNGGARGVTDVPQNRHRGQHSALVNGQAYATHVNQQQTRGQPGHQTAAELAQQYEMQALYSQALQQQQQQQQQAQTLNRQQQEQQRLLLQQQQQTNDPNASLRTLLANSYHQQMQIQQHTINQFGLGQAAVSGRHMGANLGQHVDRISTSSKPASAQHTRVLMNEQQRRDLTRPSETAVLINQNTGPSTLRNRQPQNPSPQDIFRHISPTTTGRSPPGFHPNVGSSIYQNILSNMTPNNTGIISPNRSAYSPAVSAHMSRVPASRHPQMPMTRAEIPQLNDHGNIQTNYGANQTRNISRDLQSPPQRQTTSDPVINTHVHVKRQTSSVNSCSAAVVIIDSEEDDDYNQPTSSTSDRKESRQDSSGSTQKSMRVVIDEDLEIVGMKEAEIMSHMRSDCPIHEFKRIDSVSENPQTANVSKCSKCFCYVCDKISSECPSWTDPSFPHCNAHSRASCWKARRNTKKSPLMLRLSGEETTPELNEAGALAMQYMIKIRESYITYRAGTSCDYLLVPCNCDCHTTQREPCTKCKVVHDMKKKFNYEPVRDIALGIIKEVEAKYTQTHPKMALVILEAILSELCSQRPADFNHSIRMPSNPDPRCQCNFPNIIEEHIEKNFVEILTRHEVSTSFRNHLTQCVERAIQPLQLENILRRFLNMRHWDNIQLRTVLTGANIGRREALRETADIVKLRVEKLDRDKRYQSILRYLRTVKIVQSSKSPTVSNQQIMDLMEQWNLLYSAKQGHFKDVVLRLTEPIDDKNMRGVVAGCVLSRHQPDFLLKVLDALAGVDATPNTKLDSFDPKNSHVSYQIVGKDADILMLLFQFIVQNNQLASTHVPCYLWLAKWVNRNQLSRCLDPHKIKQWVDTSKSIIDYAKHVYIHGQCQSLVMQCPVHDPHVHLFMASLNIINAVSKPQKAFLPHHMQAILDAYKNNEWALFNLLTQSVMMCSGDIGIIRWITNFCEANSPPVAQIEDRVLIESIQPYPLDDVTDLLKSLIKPDWLNSVETIQRTVIAVCSEYALRLLEELKRHDLRVLSPKGKWLEDVILNHVANHKISASLLRDDMIMNYLKNISKTCSFLSPVKRNVEIYKMISPSTEWYRRSNALIQFLQEKFTKERLTGTIEEFSTLLWLLWNIDDIDRMASFFAFFEDKHLCVDDRERVTSEKVLHEVARLLDSVPGMNTLHKKRNMMESCKRLCTLETLSWLTCAKCAEKMPTSWTMIWESIARSKLDDNLKNLNQSMLTQFRMWLNAVSLDNPESYKRLLNCLRTFVGNLINTWKKCLITFDHSRSLLLDTSKTINSCVLQRDFVLISNELIDKEIEKIKPKIKEIVETRPPIHIRPTKEHPSIKTPHPNHMVQQRVQTVLQHGPPPLVRNEVPQAVTVNNRPLDIRVVDTRPIQNKPTPSVIKGETPREEIQTTTKVHAVMSTDALFKKSPPNQEAQSPKKQVTPETATSMKKDLLFASNPTRTKVCQKCGETISCASFRCPKCNQAARTIQPVTCPGCGQENRELKGYSCQFCYRSLDVLFGRKESEEKQNEVVEHTKRKKKKSSEKRRKKSKMEENFIKHQSDTVSSDASENVNVKKVVETQNASASLKKVSEPKNMKKIAPLTLKIPLKSLNDSSDSDSLDDFITEKPQKTRKRHVSNSKVPPIKLKRKPSIVTSPKPQAITPSLTDDDSDSSDQIEKNVVVNSSEEFFVDSNKKIVKNQPSPEIIKPKPTIKQKIVILPQKPNQNEGESSGLKPQIPKPQFYNNTNPNKIANESSSPQRLADKITHTSNAPNQPPKRGVGHSSMMSKKQKNILSRLKRPGMGGQKNVPVPKTTPPNALKDPMRSPSKRPSIDNGAITSPGRGSDPAERQRHDSSCSSGSISSSTSGLSFGFASMEEKKSRNVGHRTGGPPSTKKYESNRVIIDEASNSKKALFPRPLNSAGINNIDKVKKKKHKKQRKEKKTITLTEKKLDTMIAKRGPGPASKTGYRRLLKLSQKLKKMQKSTPHKNWKLPLTVKLPKRVDLSRHAIVSLTPFPFEKLVRIRRLVPNYRIANLYA